MTMPRTVGYEVAIDWYADGDFTDPIDDVTRNVAAAPGIEIEYGRDTARSAAPPMISGSSLTLLNHDRAFSPENPGTSRYQFIKPGRPYRIRAAWGDRTPYRNHVPYRSHVPYRGRGLFPLFMGATARFGQQPALGARTVDVTALGSTALLQRTIVSFGFLGGSPRIDTLVTAILNAAGWPAAKRAISVADAVVDGYWVDERTAWDCLVELTATEGAGALLAETPDGTLVFQNRNYRATNPRSQTSQYTFADADGPPIAGALFYTDLAYDPRWEDVVDRVVVTTTQRELQTFGPVWKLGTTYDPSYTPSTIWARPSDPFLFAVAPVLGTDYTVTAGTATVTLAWADGAIAKLTVLATSGSPTIHDLQLRANAWTVVGETLIESTATPEAVTDTQTMNIAAWPQLQPAHAKAIADSYLDRYHDPHEIVTVTVMNLDAAHLEAMLDLQLSDRVRIVNRHLGINREYVVEKLAHRVTQGGLHALTFWCQPVVAIGSSGGIWDSGRWDMAVWGI